MRVSAIIPAYNEESTVEGVIKALKSSNKVDEIIVVSDGSTDRTAEISMKNGANVIELSENVGKGGAMKIGVKKCSGDVVLFVDADLVGLKSSHIDDLVSPVINNNADMTIGIFSGGRLPTDLAQKITPFLSGQRAMKKDIFNNIDIFASSGYGIETALTVYGKKKNIKMENVELKDLTHVMKEEKLGFVKGFRARMKMYWEVYKGLRCIR